MPEIPTSATTVIIGGGVMGASTLYHLAARGHSDVVLLEREAFFGTGATGRCAGGIRHQFATRINIELSKLSIAMMADFEAITGTSAMYHPCGYLFVLTRPEAVTQFQHNVALQHEMGVDTEWLSGDEVRRRLPQFRFDDALAGTFYGKDGLADPNSVVMGYITAARQRGAKAENDVTVTGIETRSGRVIAVQTNAGRIETETVINAGGPWAAQLGAMAGVKIPIVPVRRQWLTTSAIPELPRDLPMVVDFATTMYLHREGDGLLSGMSNPNQLPGFDQSVDEDFEMVHMETAIARLPLLERAGLASHMAGLYEVTPDHHPIISATAVDGFYVVAGFSGHGFMHGPAAGLVMAELLLDGAAHSIDIGQLDLARFVENRLVEEYNVI